MIHPNAPVEMADNSADFQLHLAHQGAHRLFKRDRPAGADGACQQATHRIVHAKRAVRYAPRPASTPALSAASALNNARTGANGGNGLADVVVQFARRLGAHSLRSPADVLLGGGARQFSLQGLDSAPRRLNTCPRQQPGQALRQQKTVNRPGDHLRVWLAISAMAFISVAISACQP